MKRFLSYIFVFIFCSIFAAGCSKIEMEACNKKSQEQVEEELKNYIKENYGDTVTLSLTSKEQLSIPTAWFDGPMMYKDVSNGEKYSFDVIPDRFPDIKGVITYADAYTKEEDGAVSEHEAVITTNYEDVVERYSIFLDFKALVERYDANGFTYQVKDTNNFIAAVSIEDFDNIWMFRDEMYSLLRKYRDKQYIEVNVFYLDNHDIDFSPVKNADLQPNTGEYEYEIVKALGKGAADRFAAHNGNKMDQFEDFFNTKAGKEEYWRLASDDSELKDKFFYMKKDYNDYKSVSFMESMEPNKTDITIYAWGLYDQ